MEPQLPESAPVEVDFFGIGAPKCASTWLARCLDEHPALAISRPKETQFLVADRNAFTSEPNPDLLRDWDWYASCFDHAAPGVLRGDFSVQLLSDAGAPERLHRLYPDARFLLVLRDPVERTYSHYQHGRRTGASVPATFEAALEHEPLLRRSLYGANLQRWLRVFPRERFLVLLHDDVRAQPEALVRSAYRFLGVDEAYRPPSLEVRVDQPSVERGIPRLAGHVAHRLRGLGLGPVVDAAKSVGLHRVVSGLKERGSAYPPMPGELRARLRARFRPDVELLEDLMELDLEGWRGGP